VKMSARRERVVTVCAACLCASCWHGDFMCDEAKDADITTRTVSQLRKLRREHPSHYSVKKIREVCGS
jgi:hypothetical protein